MGKHLFNLRNAILSIFLLATMSLLAGAPTWQRVNYTNSTTFVGINKISNHDDVTVGDYIGGFVDGECRMIGQFFENDGELYISAILHGGDVFGADGDNVGELVEFRMWDNETDAEYTDIKGTTLTIPGGSIYMYPIGEGSKDNNLESLVVDGYTFDFDSLTTDYDLTVPVDGAIPAVEDITAVAADDRATVVSEVVDNVVTVTVTSEFGEDKVYTITFTQDICDVVAPTADAEVAICEGSDLTLTATATVEGATLNWYSDLAEAAIGTGESITVDAAGTYYVTQTDGCEGTAAEVVLTVTAIPDAPVVTGGEYCPSADGVELSADGVNIVWYSDAELTTEIDASVAVLEGSYFATQTVEECKSPAAEAVVTELTIEDITITPSTESICVSSEPVTFTFSTDGGTLSGVGVTDNAFDPATAGAGDHTLTYKITEPCATSATIVITVGEGTAPSADPVTINVGDDVAPLVATGSGTIKWYDAADGESIADGESFTPTTVDNSEEGSYTFYVTNTDGDCESEMKEVLYNVSGCTVTAPDVEGTEVCEGATEMPSFEATPAEGNTIMWYTDASLTEGEFEGETYTPAAPGTYYYVEVGSCQSSPKSVELVENAKPVITGTEDVPTSTCESAAIIDLSEYLSASTTIAEETYTGTIEGTSEFDPSKADNIGGANAISYTVVNDKNCAESIDLEITVEAAPTSDITFPDESVKLSELPYDFGTLQGTLTGTGVTQDGQDFTFEAVSGTGSYSLTYTIEGEEGGCSLILNKSIVVVKDNDPCADAEAPATPVVADVTIMVGETIPTFELSNKVAGATVVWNGTLEADTFTPEDETVGEYTYTVTQTNECDLESAEASFMFTILDELDPCADAEAPATPVVADVEITVGDPIPTFELSNKEAGATVVWNGTLEADTFTPDDETVGEYTYTVTQTNECDLESAEASFTFTIIEDDPCADAVAPAKPSVAGATILEDETIPTFELSNKEAGATVVWNGTLEADTFTPEDDAVGVYTYTVTQTNECDLESAETSFTFEIKSKDDPCAIYVTAPEVDPIADLCEGSSVPELEGTTDIDGAEVVWYDENDDEVSSMPTAAGTYTFYAIAEGGECASPKSEDVSFTINETPAITLDATTYKDDVTVVEPTVTPAGGTLMLDDVAQSTISFSPKTLGEGTYILKYISEAGCSSDEVTVTVSSDPIVLDKKPLEDAIEVAEARKDEVTDSVPASYPMAAYSDLTDAIADAKVALASAETDADITEAVKALEDAVADFNATYIEPESVVIEVTEIEVSADKTSIVITFDGDVTADALAQLDDMVISNLGYEVEYSLTIDPSDDTKLIVDFDNELINGVVTIELDASEGVSKIDEIVAVTSVDDALIAEVKLYPTVGVVDQVTIINAENVTEVVVTALSSVQVAVNVELGSTIKLDVADLESGIYYVTVKAGDASKVFDLKK